MTDTQRLLARRYIVYKTLDSMWFMGAVWLYFYRIFITDQQVGVLDGLAFAIGLAAEVPSGALADKFGKDKVVRVGWLLAGAGLFMQAAGSSFMPFFVGQSILMVGLAFVSGADEALFFEKLNFKRKSTEWRKLVTRGSQVALTVRVLVTISGGWMHSINPRIPWYLTGLAFIIAGIVIWPIKDTRIRQARQKFLPELRDYLRDIGAGFAEFRHKKLRLYVPYMIAVQGLFYVSGYGILRIILLDRFYFSPFLGSVAIAVSSVVTVGLLAYMHKNADNLSEKKVLASVGLIAASSLLLSLADIGLWGYVVILAMYGGEHILSPFMSEVFNHRASDDRRATVLSVASFIKALPYVALGPTIGFLNTNGRLEYFLIIWAIFVVLSVALYLSAKKRDDYISLA